MKNRSVLFVCALVLCLAIIAGPAMAVCQIDVDGANDPSGDGQKDLTQFCLEEGTDGFELWTKLNWDETDVGSQTADTCTLYDTDVDGNANYAVCIQWEGVQQLTEVRLFSCNEDSRPENCLGSVLLNYCSNSPNYNNAIPCQRDADCGDGTCQLHDASLSHLVIGVPHTNCEVTNSLDDPFAGDPSVPKSQGNEYPADTQAVCNVDLNDFGTFSPIMLLNACSYPSASTPSNASDCVMSRGCSSNDQCNDNVACTTNVCDTSMGAGVCRYTPVDGNCDDSLWCNGAETCDAALGCQAGPVPVCADNIACTVDSCNEVTDTCNNLPNNAVCDDFNDCSDDFCDPGNGCASVTSDPNTECDGGYCNWYGECVPDGSGCTGTGGYWLSHPCVLDPIFEDPSVGGCDFTFELNNVIVDTADGARNVLENGVCDPCTMTSGKKTTTFENPLNQLYQQTLSAELAIHNCIGDRAADQEYIQPTLTDIEFFLDNTPCPDGCKLSRIEKNRISNWNNILSQFNTGILVSGPPECQTSSCDGGETDGSPESDALSIPTLSMTPTIHLKLQ